MQKYLLPIKVIDIKKIAYIILLSSFTFIFINCKNLDRNNPYDPYSLDNNSNISVFITSPSDGEQITISQWIQLTFMGIAFKDGKEIIDWEAYNWYVDGKYLFTGRIKSYYSFPVGWHDVVLRVNVGNSYGVSRIVRFKVNTMY
jgi:hypothetical protein